MDLRIGHDNSDTGSVLDGILSLTLFSAYTPDTSTQVISVQGLHILDLKGLKEQVVQSKNSNGVLQIETKHKSLDEVSALLYSSDILSSLRSPNLDSPSLCVHTHLQLHVLDKCLKYALPVLLERGESVARHRDPSILVFDTEVGNLNLVKLYLVVVLFRLHSLEAHQLVTLRII